MEPPKISIITVVYNAVSTIADCIESVINQTYQNIEYIIIDGNSTDGTKEVIEKYKSKVALIKSEPDKGIYDAMNKGITFATGDYVGILNADDFYKDNVVIEKVAQQLLGSLTDGLYGDLIFVDSKKTNEVKRYWKAGKYSKNKFLYGWMPPHPTFFLKKSFYNKFGGFRLDLGSASDYELMLRMIHKNQAKLAYLREVLIVMRIGGVSTSNVGNRLDANKNDARAWKVNNLKPYFFTTYLKPFRKITQFFQRPTSSLYANR